LGRETTKSYRNRAHKIKLTEGQRRALGGGVGQPNLPLNSAAGVITAGRVGQKVLLWERTEAKSTTTRTPMGGRKEKRPEREKRKKRSQSPRS